MRLSSIDGKISRKNNLESITESFNHILQNQVFQTDDNLRKFREYLDDNYQNHISLTGNSNIPKDFKKKIGISPFEFLQIYRISKAIEMMKTNDLSVSEVAYKVGYENLVAFERQFKKYTRSVPSEFKNGLLPKKNTKKSEDDTFQDPKESLEDIIEYYPQIKRVIKFIEENYKKKISQEDIANAAYMNKDYLSSYFHEKTGILLRDFINNLRIYKAIEMMKTNNLNVSEVADKVGYKDLKTFERNFKRLAGKNPIKFKQKLRPAKPKIPKSIDLRANGYDNIKKSLEEVISYYLPIKRAIEYMEKNFSEKISLEDVAAAAIVGPTYFSTIFHTTTGIKLILEYLNIIRINEAMKIIKKGDKKIIDVAFAVGYQDQKTLERNFKKYVKVTAPEYKKSLNENKN